MPQDIVYFVANDMDVILYFNQISRLLLHGYGW